MAVIKLKQKDGTYKTIKSIRGKSAYELAVKNGFEGTEKEWLDSLGGGDISDTTMKVTDANNHFTADGSGNKYLSSVLDQLFQFADNGKKSIAQIIGSPLSADDTFGQMGEKIQELLDSIKEALESKGITLDGDETLEDLINKIDSDVSKSLFPKWVYNGDIWFVCAANPDSDKYTCQAISDKIYYFTHTNTYCYDPETNTFEDKNANTNNSAMSVSCSSSVTANGKIYIISGSYNECYDPSTDTWESKLGLTGTLMTPQVPIGKAMMACSYINDKIYCMGGYSGGGNNNNYCYFISTNTWTIKNNLPQKTFSATSIVFNEKIYLIGGNGTEKNIYLYNLDTDTWTRKTNMPTGGYDLASSILGDKIYVIGGNGGRSRANEYYDPNTDTWSTKTNLPIGIYQVCSAVVDNKIYCTGYGNVNIECYIPSQI